MEAEQERALRPIQARVLGHLRDQDVAETVDEIACGVFHGDCLEPPNDHERKSTYECLKDLENRGLVKSYTTWIRDIGTELVWRSARNAKRTALDPGW
ncbi:hypothetical protein [Nocardia sp. NPDC002869]|uniref:hypothetical protein n=1 Tax=Nocardia sp. NPDC002869 TaxID=3161032 RepID=UPI00398CC1E9